jgi:hypothetical protein
MFKHAAAGARRRWPILVLSLVSVSALALSAFTLLAGAAKGRNLASAASSVSDVATAKADGVDASDFACTCAPYFVDMAGMTKIFKLGGRISRPVIVLFQSKFFTDTENNIAFIRLTIDGVPQQYPGGIPVDHRPTGGPRVVGTHGFNFISYPLTPGTHTATIQWHDSGVGPYYAEQRSLIILHK